MANVPWIADGITGFEDYAADALRTISFIDTDASALIMSFLWAGRDNITRNEASAINVLGDIMVSHPDLAGEVLGFQWVRDDITGAEWRALVNIRDLAENDLELAWHLIRSPFMESPFLQRDGYALSVLSIWSRTAPPPGLVFSGEGVEAGPDLSVDFQDEYLQGSALLAHLAAQPWFSDGIDDMDAALLHSINYDTGEMRQALIETPHVTSITVDLPFSGTVGIAVVRHASFPPNDHALPSMEEGLRVMENFMGAPLPANDVILLLVEPGTLGAKGTHVQFCAGGGTTDPCHLSSRILVEDRGSGAPIRTIFHELGHYYFVNGPRWLVEGTANFLEAYIVAQTGGEQLEERLAHLESSQGCSENIWQHVNPYRGGICDYQLGEKFLIGMYEALGPEPVAAALRELYVQSYLFENPNHDSIYYAFLSNTPPEKEEAFLNAYRRYHGRPFSRPGPDSPEFASLMALYNSTNGDHWLSNRNWGSEAPLGAWYGVYTNAIGQVTGLELSENALAGNIPPELGGLPDLQGLNLRDNALTGEIPAELGDLISISQLDLAWNQLTGELPPELGDLTKLVELRVGGNQLTGELPWQLGNLSALYSLTIHDNQLTGEIPSELSGLSGLQVLWLGGNRFTGCIAEGLPDIWVEETKLRRC